MWNELSSGKLIYTVDKHNKIKKHSNFDRKQTKSMINKLEKDENVQYLLTTGLSYKHFENLARKSRGKSFTDIDVEIFYLCKSWVGHNSATQGDSQYYQSIVTLY